MLRFSLSVPSLHATPCLNPPIQGARAVRQALHPVHPSCAVPRMPIARPGAHSAAALVPLPSVLRPTCVQTGRNMQHTLGKSAWQRWGQGARARAIRSLPVWAHSQRTRATAVCRPSRSHVCQVTLHDKGSYTTRPIYTDAAGRSNLHRCPCGLPRPKTGVVTATCTHRGTSEAQRDF